MGHVVMALQKPVMLKILLCLLLLVDHLGGLALAASGGVMGGSDFSSFSDSRSSKSDSSYNSYSSRKEYSPYNSYSSASDSSLSKLLDSLFNSYSCASDSSYCSHRRSPCDYSESKSSNHVHPMPTISVADILVIMGFIAFILICCYLLYRCCDDNKSTKDVNWEHRECRCLLAPTINVQPTRNTSFKTSVFKLQVGLLGTARSLQKDLNEIAKTPNTSTSDGFRHILKATIGALLQHPDYYTSGYSCVETGSSVQEAEKRFQKHSFDERSKFDEETLVNLNNFVKQSAISQNSSEYTVADMGSTLDEEPWVNVENIRKRYATSQISNGVCNEYVVVTIIVAACGLHTLPSIKSNAELKKALQTLASVPSNKIMAAVVLWTPQKKDDTLSEQELREKYPLLYPL